MTIAELVYFIGFGVAAIMTWVASVNLCAKQGKDFNEYWLGIFSSGLFAGLLSWAVPIWYMGYLFSQKVKMVEKNKRGIKND